MMYERIASQPRVRKQFADVVVGRGFLTRAEADAMVEGVDAELEAARGAIAAHKEKEARTGASPDLAWLTDPAELARQPRVRRSPRSVSSTASRRSRPTHSSCGRRSSETSPTSGRRSSDRNTRPPRLKRFLQLAAEGNIRVVNCTTPAQYFHALRWQALRATCRPLIVMTPKRLLRPFRAPVRRSRISPARRFGRCSRIRTWQSSRISCTGSSSAPAKVYFDPLAEPPAARDIPILRVEQPCPFPAEDLAAMLAPYPRTAEICWVQEEPTNMDAWTFMRPHLRELIARKPGRGLFRQTRPPPTAPAPGRAPDVLTPGAGYGKLLKLIIQRRVDVATGRGLTSSATDQ